MEWNCIGLAPQSEVYYFMPQLRLIHDISNILDSKFKYSQLH